MPDDKMKPLYMRYGYQPVKYRCVVTGSECKIATDYFTKLHKKVEQAVKDGRTFIITETNVCSDRRCPIWDNVMIKIEEFAKQNSK